MRENNNLPRSYAKPKTLRNKAYLRWLRDQPCALCGQERTEYLDVVPAHASGGGIGIKAGDDTCIPLCVRHHSLEHSAPMIFNAMLEAVTGKTRQENAKRYWERYHG